MFVIQHAGRRATHDDELIGVIMKMVLFLLQTAYTTLEVV